MCVETELIILIANIDVHCCRRDDIEAPTLDDEYDEYCIDGAHGTIAELAERRISVRLHVR